MPLLRLLDPRSTVAVIIGASDWSGASLQPAPSFRRSARAFSAYLNRQAGLEAETVLNLFDEDRTAGDQLTRIAGFLEERVREGLAEGRPIEDVLVYYVGHGCFGPGEHLGFMLRATRKSFEFHTSLHVQALADVLRRSTPHQRRLMVLDCCFSEAATRSFFAMSGPLDQVVAAAAAKELPKRGTMLLCSSPRGEISIGAPNAERTLFTGALLQVLTRGARDRPELLSFADLRDEAEEEMVRMHGNEAPRPTLHSLDEMTGDLKRLPAFRNPEAERRVADEVNRSSKQSPRPTQAVLGTVRVPEVDRSKRWVIVGGGRLGRGYLNEVAHELGYRTLLVVAGEKTPSALVREYNRRQAEGIGYVVEPPEYPVKQLTQYEFRTAIDATEVTEAIAAPDTQIVSTSVGLKNLKRASVIIGEALKRRLRSGTCRPVDLLVCENGRTEEGHWPADYLRRLLADQFEPMGLELDHAANVLTVIVDCRVPLLSNHAADAIPRGAGTIWIEHSDRMSVDNYDHPSVRITRFIGLVAKQKLYGFNSLHCFISTLGSLVCCDHVQDVAQAREIRPHLNVLPKILAEAVKAGESEAEITAFEADEKRTIESYCVEALQRLREPKQKKSKDPVLRAVENVCSGHYFADGRIAGPLLALGGDARPSAQSLLTHMVSLCVFKYLKNIDLIRSALPFVTPSSPYDESVCGPTLPVNLAAARMASILSGDMSNRAVMSAISVDLSILERWMASGQLSLGDMSRFLRRQVDARPLVPRVAGDVDIQCVVFDLDEGLVATESLLYQVTRKLISDHSRNGRTISHEEYATWVGEGEEYFFQNMNPRFDIKIPPKEMVRERERRFIGALQEIGSVDSERLIKPGFPTVLTHLRKAEVRMAVYTNASRARVEATLDYTGLRSYFDEILSATDDRMTAKPSPVMLESMMERRGISPAQCIVVESSDIGVRSALRAGCFCVLLGTDYRVPRPLDLRGVMLLANARELATWTEYLLRRKGRLRL